MNLLVVSDDRHFRKDIVFQLHQFAQVNLIKSVGYKDELLEAIQCGTFHLMVIDISNPIEEQVEAISTIESTFPLIRTIHIRNTAFNVSALGWSMKELKENTYPDAEPIDFHDLILGAVQRGKMIAPRPKLTHPLTNKEEAILRMFCLDYDCADIARHFDLSPRTIEGYKTKIKHKVGVKGMAGLVLFAIHQNLIEVKLPEMIYTHEAKKSMNYMQTA